MPRKIPGDWYEGGIPDNSVVAESACIETGMIFDQFRSTEPDALVVGEGCGIYTGSFLETGPRGRIVVGKYSMLTSVFILADDLVEIGDHCLISWTTVIMDTRRVPFDVEGRRRALRQSINNENRRIAASDAPTAPIHIGNNVWIGFDAVILPGVRIGDGSIIGCKSVVASDIPAYVVAAGNPARVVKSLDPGARIHGA